MKSFPSTSFLFVATISAVLLGVVLLVILVARYLTSKIYYNITCWFGITKYDCQWPKRDHILIAILDQTCTLLAVAGGGTSGQAQVGINQSVIPLTLLFSWIGLNRYFNLGYWIVEFAI